MADRQRLYQEHVQQHACRAGLSRQAGISRAAGMVQEMEIFSRGI